MIRNVCTKLKYVYDIIAFDKVLMYCTVRMYPTVFRPSLAVMRKAYCVTDGKLYFIGYICVG